MVIHAIAQDCTENCTYNFVPGTDGILTAPLTVRDAVRELGAARAASPPNRARDGIIDCYSDAETTELSQES